MKKFRIPEFMQFIFFGAFVFIIFFVLMYIDRSERVETIKTVKITLLSGDKRIVSYRLPSNGYFFIYSERGSYWLKYEIKGRFFESDRVLHAGVIDCEEIKNQSY